MAQIGTLNSFTALSKVEALDLNYNYNEIASKFNEHENATTDVHGVTSPNRIVGKNEVEEFLLKHRPIGSLIYLWDNNNALLSAIISSDIYIEMDGTSVEDQDSLYNQTELPDMSEVYIVGGESGLSQSFVGNSNNSLNLSHSHTNTHTHGLSSHRHNIVHSHIPAVDLQVFWDRNNGGRELYLAKTTSNSTDATHYLREAFAGTTGSSNTYTQGIPSIMSSTNVYPNFDTGYTDYKSLQSGTNSNVTSSSNISTSVDINLVNLKCRCFLRYK